MTRRSFIASLFACAMIMTVQVPSINDLPRDLAGLSAGRRYQIKCTAFASRM